MRLLFLGDIVGRPGRRAVAQFLPRFAAREGVDFVVANCENASGGKGIDPRTAEELRDAGIDVLTSGNHVWQKRDILPYLAENERLLRPLNFAPGTPGRGWTAVTRRGRPPCRYSTPVHRPLSMISRSTGAAARRSGSST